MSRERAYFRIRYPILARPRFVADEIQTEVLDVAEYGISFKIEAFDELAVGDPLSGTLHIADRHSLELEGHVVWVTGGLAAIRLVTPIPYKVIIDEQLLLRTRYSGM